MRASSSEKNKTQLNPEQDISKTQLNSHLNANQGEERSDTQGLTEGQTVATKEHLMFKQSLQ